ncbi:hypothetical protein IT570_00405 [Candidatus Sumerlaeota bacterium]|nr:hypothetical protein [Candidatus Sumerlaeota bacterium]
MIDVIVVGSGASAINAAYPLVEAGLRVLMIDAGITDEKYAGKIPAQSFREIRSTDDGQHEYFLGHDFEGIPFGPVRVGAQLTPPRQYLTRRANDLLPVLNGNFEALRSFARGGFASGWGASSPPFTNSDMRGWPIKRTQLQAHYERVALRIGLCGENDPRLREFLGDDLPLLSAPRVDSNAQFILRRYRANRGAFNRRGFHMGAARLACATEKFRGRGPLTYHDMEFWADADKAIYRPVYTLQELKAHPNFEYRSNLLVESFKDSASQVTIIARNLVSQTTEHFTAAKLILTAGTICTTAIVLRSLGNASLPILSNPYIYYPCVVWPMFGRKVRDRRHSLTQLSIYYRPHDPTEPLVQAQVYSYRSLMLYKLLKESPFPHRESIRLLQLMQNYFIIVGLHHEDRPTTSKTITMDGDGIDVSYRLSQDEKSLQMRNEKRLMRNFASLGCLPIRRINPGPGASIHYGGSLPMSIEDKPYTTTPTGQLRGTHRVLVADGSILPHLPSKGLTLTLMANADRIGKNLADEMKAS